MKAKSKKTKSVNQLKPAKAIPREQWEKHFKLAIKAGYLHDKKKVEMVSDRYDESDWTW